MAVANANYVRNFWAFYGDDTYKITSKLTISPGLRYELTPPWNDTFGNNFNVDIQVMPKHDRHQHHLSTEPMAVLCTPG